jgi:hypothetical protein
MRKSGATNQLERRHGHKGPFSKRHYRERITHKDYRSWSAKNTQKANVNQHPPMYQSGWMMH